MKNVCSALIISFVFATSAHALEWENLSVNSVGLATKNYGLSLACYEYTNEVLIYFWPPCSEKNTVRDCGLVKHEEKATLTLDNETFLVEVLGGDAEGFGLSSSDDHKEILDKIASAKNIAVLYTPLKSSAYSFKDIKNQKILRRLYASCSGS